MDHQRVPSNQVANSNKNNDNEARGSEKSDLNMDYRHLRRRHKTPSDDSSTTVTSHVTFSGLSLTEKRPYAHGSAPIGARLFSPLRSGARINDEFRLPNADNVNANVISEIKRDAYCANHGDVMQSGCKCKQCQTTQKQHCNNVSCKPISCRPLAAALVAKPAYQSSHEICSSHFRFSRRHVVVKRWRQQQRQNSKDMVVDSCLLFKALFVLLLALELYTSSMSQDLIKSIISKLQNSSRTPQFNEQSNHERIIATTQQDQLTPLRCLQETTTFHNYHSKNSLSFFKFASAFEGEAGKNNISINININSSNENNNNNNSNSTISKTHNGILSLDKSANSSESTTLCPGLDLNSTLAADDGQLKANSSSTVRPIDTPATPVTTMAAIVSSTTATSDQNQLSPGMTINVICNSCCQCIKLGFQTKSGKEMATGDESAILNYNETMKERLELEKKLRAFSELHSSMMFADNDNSDANYTRENETASSFSPQRSSLDNPSLVNKNWPNTRLMGNNANYADQQLLDMQQQQQQQNSMVFSLPSNYHHGGQQHHQHYRLMQLYPHLAHHRDRASMAQSDPMLNMVSDEKSHSQASTLSKKQLITNNVRQQRNNSVHTEIAVLAGLGSNPNNDANYDLSSIIVEKIMPLKELNLTSQLNDPNTTLSQNFNVATFEMGNFTLDLKEKITQLMAQVEREEVESLSLRHNSLEFELWAEIYSLLVVRARRHLYHLDLSYNQLAKLGVTFTGYIEHHLIASRGDWPFTSSSNQSSLLKFINVNNNNNIMSQPLSAGGPLNLQAASAISSGKSSQSPQQTNKPYTLTSGGKLFTIVQQKLKQQLSSLSNSSVSSSINIRALDLSHNSLKWLINDQFRALKHVQSIKLDHNKIRFIHQHAFTGLESLRFLNLAYNKLQVIYIEQFQSNYNLQALSLRANTIAYLRAGSFASLGNLKQLDLSQNKLTMLSNNAFIGLESLEWLNLSSNLFVHVPSGTLHPLTGLRKLDLSNNLMDQLAPGTFFHLPIEELWLNQNEQLVSVDRGAFWDMPYLTRLYLHSCPMLISINSQAFVGIHNLNFINAEDCQSLEQDSRQLLENITTASTLRQLRQEQKQQIKGYHKLPSNLSVGSLGDTQLINGTSDSVAQNLTQQLSQFVPKILPKAPSIVIDGNNNMRSVSSTAAAANPDDISHIIDIANHRLKYAYYTTSLVFLIIALKLVLKYTQVGSGRSSSSFRNRRRVYETSDSFDCDHQVHDDLGHEGLSVGGESYELQENPIGVHLRQTTSSTHKKRNYCSSVSLSSEPSSISALSNPHDDARSQEVDLGAKQADQEEGSNKTNNNEQLISSTNEIKVTNGDADICVESGDGNMMPIEDELVEIPLNDYDEDHRIEDDCQLGQDSSQFDLSSSQKPDDTMIAELHTNIGEMACDQVIANAITTNSPCDCCECPSYRPANIYESIPVAVDGEASSDNGEQVSEINDCNEHMERGNGVSAMSDISSQQQGLNMEFINCDLCNTSPSECDHSNSTFSQVQGSITTTYTQNDTINQLLQTQLIGARYEFDHANCNHFYQTFDSAYQLADLVNHELNQEYY